MNEDGLDGIHFSKILPMGTLRICRRLHPRTAVVALDLPASHQNIPTEAKAYFLGITTNCISQKTA
jgi:hypothetical protein